MKLECIQVLRPKPFVKWAGGKRQILPLLNQHFPKKFDSYYEPFLGGGAVLFHLLSEDNNHKFHASDLNSNLILAYVTIRDKINDLLPSLKNHSKNYSKDSKSYYYSVRNSNPKNQIEKVSRLLFLNRTCFNGLYRVNKKGWFNVPLGSYSNPNIVNEGNLRTVSEILQSNKITITDQDFAEIESNVKKNDFVYFDPPYHPVSNTSNFTKYTDKSFNENNLLQLVKLCKKLDERGCKIMISNSNSELVKNHFSDKKWRIHKIKVNRWINSNSQKRTGHYELLIKNY